MDSTNNNPAPSKRRGRPPTGKALTPAQRKEAQRIRDATRVWAGEEDGKNVTVTGYIEAIARAAKNKQPRMVEILAKELVAKLEEETDKPKIS